MPRRPHLRTIGVVALGTIAALLSACGSSAPAGPPHIAAFEPTAGSATACRAIIADLPHTLIGQRRVISTGSRFGAAWGDPAIILRCGVAEPSGFNAVSACLTVNGVDWFASGDLPSMNAASPTQTITVTTVYRKPAIEVTVPASYGTQGPGTAMALLTAVVKNHTRVSRHCV